MHGQVNLRKERVVTIEVATLIADYWMVSYVADRRAMWMVVLWFGTRASNVNEGERQVPKLRIGDQLAMGNEKEPK